MNRPYEDAVKEAAALRQRVAELEAGLKLLEWEGRREPPDGGHDWDYCCPACGARKEGADLYDGEEYEAGEHARDCWLRATLSAPSASEGSLEDLARDLLNAGLLDGALEDSIDMIAAERVRQVEEEGWGAEHDDRHSDGYLAVVAAALALDGTDAVKPALKDSWGLVEKHGTDRMRALTVAGALIAAEMDRLRRRDRLSASEGEALPAPEPEPGSRPLGDDVRQRGLKWAASQDITGNPGARTWAWIGYMAGAQNEFPRSEPAPTKHRRPPLVITDEHLDDAPPAPEPALREAGDRLAEVVRLYRDYGPSDELHEKAREARTAWTDALRLPSAPAWGPPRPPEEAPMDEDVLMLYDMGNRKDFMIRACPGWREEPALEAPDWKLIGWWPLPPLPPRQDEGGTP